ncbi:hypothetical protein [Phocaeicola salanitronis]|uniref:hypothetical protein n=1 Tax=Phocaeicola salanitronis TaxID=376805 RepID=UPI0023F63203|nr:hypothetical protein [Phocaeicola salanitronis]
MKTNVLTQMWGIFLIMTVCLLASCSENDTPALALTDPAEMYEPDLTFRGDALSLQINGTTVTDCSVYFEPVKEDSTQMMMYIMNYVPTQPVGILVKTTPGEGVVTFESVKDSYINYEAQLKGTYHAETNGVSRQVQAEGAITPYPINTETTEYLFDKKNTLAIQTGGNGLWDFVQSVLDKICLRIAKEITGIKLQFHEDTTFDIWMKRAGQTDYELWMTARYWIDPQYTNSMSWLFTPEQCEQFCAQWLGSPLDPYGKSPFQKWGDYYELPITYWNTSNGFAWTIANPNRYTALDMFMQGKGMEGLTEEEKQEMEMFSQVLYDVEDLSDWMSWCIVLVPNTIAN